jgi:hypothetical protein
MYDCLSPLRCLVQAAVCVSPAGAEEAREHSVDFLFHCDTLVLFLVLLVNDSEYSRSTGAKPILSLSCIYLVSPGALLLLLLLRQLRIFAAAAARAPLKFSRVGLL